MAQALRLAERGLYSTTPNPRVGCVIVKGGEVVGEGWHEKAGEPHAEVHSLRAAGDSRFPAVVGSTLMWTVGLGSALGLAFGARWGVAGIWMGMAVDEWTRALTNGWRWRTGAWQRKGVT